MQARMRGGRPRPEDFLQAGAWLEKASVNRHLSPVDALQKEKLKWACDPCIVVT
jgi:hypothetical protein